MIGVFSILCLSMVSSLIVYPILPTLMPGKVPID